MSNLVLERGVVPAMFPQRWDMEHERACKMTISPAEAAWVLENKNSHNRSISEHNRDRIEKSLRGGHWRINGETVIFCSDGSLGDGQTRLSACARTGIPLTTWVVFGVDPSCFESIDRGKNRLCSDDLKIEGEKNCSLLAAVLGLLKMDEIGKIDTPASGFETWELRAVLDRNPKVRQSVDYVASRKQLRALLVGRVAAFCHYRFSVRDRAACGLFFDDLISGAMLGSTDAVLLLRNRLLSNNDSKAKLPFYEILAITIKAWNYRRAHKQARCLKWNPDGMEPFPEIR